MITIKKGDIIKLDGLYWEVISRGKNTCIVKFGDRERVVLKKDIKLVVGKEIQLFKLKQET